MPDRFELRILDLLSLRSAMEELLALLRSNCPPELRILITVSPVPLNATFRNADVITANMYSKSVLRVLAEELYLQHRDVDYFPSYESVMLSHRDRAFLDDFRHVRDDLVGLNVNRMINAYLVSRAQADPEQLCQKGNSWNRQSRFAEALECFEAALKVLPGHLGSLRGSAASLRMLERFEEATARLHRVLEADPADAASIYLLALIEFQRRAFGDSLSLLKTVISLDRRNAGAHYLMARCCLERKEWQAGLAAVGEAVDLIPNHPGFRYWKSRLELEIGNLAAAETDIDVAIREKPENAEYHYQRALVLVRRGRPEDAATAAEVALRLQPSNTRYANRLAGYGSRPPNVDRPRFSVAGSSLSKITFKCRMRGASGKRWGARRDRGSGRRVRPAARRDARVVRCELRRRWVGDHAGRPPWGHERRGLDLLP